MEETFKELYNQKLLSLGVGRRTFLMPGLKGIVITKINSFVTYLIDLFHSVEFYFVHSSQIKQDLATS